MANYLDILRQFQDAKRVTDPQYKPINPYTSAAYTYSSAKDLYQQGLQSSLQSKEAEGYIPQSVYQKPTTADKITQGVVSATQAGEIESKVSPLLKNIGSKIPTTTVDGVTSSKLFGKKLPVDAAEMQQVN